MTRRDGGATDRAPGPRDEDTEDEYESGYRFGEAWLFTDEGRKWRQGRGAASRSPVPGLRRLANDRGREYVRGFYDAIMRQELPATDHGGRARPITVSVTLTTEEYAAIKSFQAADGVATATRIRAMIAAYSANAAFREAIDAALRVSPPHGERIRPPGAGHRMCAAQAVDCPQIEAGHGMSLRDKDAEKFRSK